MRATAIRLAIGLAAIALVTAGCSHARPPGHDHGAVDVVASTDVWGSVASAVAGDHASVDVDRDQLRRRPALV